MNDWIDVRARLPKDHPRRCHLVCYVGSAHGTPRRNRRRMLLAIFSGGLWRFMGPQKDTRLSERVTHWMPKPKLPRTRLDVPRRKSVPAQGSDIA